MSAPLDGRRKAEPGTLPGTDPTQPVDPGAAATGDRGAYVRSRGPRETHRRHQPAQGGDTPKDAREGQNGGEVEKHAARPGELDETKARARGIERPGREHHDPKGTFQGQWLRELHLLGLPAKPVQRGQRALLSAYPSTVKLGDHGRQQLPGKGLPERGQGAKREDLSGAKRSRPRYRWPWPWPTTIQQVTESRQNFFFLDEDSRSLDKESLNIVFDTLKSLRKENRIVGVISHVEEMQQEIDAHLTVENHPERGSLIHRD